MRIIIIKTIRHNNVKQNYNEPTNDNVKDDKNDNNNNSDKHNNYNKIITIITILTS